MKTHRLMITFETDEDDPARVASEMFQLLDATMSEDAEVWETIKLVRCNYVVNSREDRN